jgi:hypothetical protein
MTVVGDDESRTKLENSSSPTTVIAINNHLTNNVHDAISDNDCEDEKATGRMLWNRILLQKEDKDDDEIAFNNNNEDHGDIFTALSSIRILDDVDNDDDPKNKKANNNNEEWLDRLHGHLYSLSPGLLEELRNGAPNIDDMSTVADFNDNLLYHMQRDEESKRSILNNGSLLSPEHVEELRRILRCDDCLGSYLTTKRSIPQPAHVDFAWEVLEQTIDDRVLSVDERWHVPTGMADNPRIDETSKERFSNYCRRRTRHHRG